jgi:phosphopantothenoylcysteine decarboxylase / phosphopantothenate---cysteine ligase
MTGKKLLLGVTGSIAAYKAAYIIRFFIKNAYEVRVIMTPDAVSFISPLTLGVLAKNKVFVNFSDDSSWNSHVDFGLWADYFLIAPATANTLAKMAVGIADNLLLTTYLSIRCRTGVAPAMDMDMYKSASVQENLEKLQSLGIDIFEPESGELASGLVGEGRLIDPEDLFIKVDKVINKKDLTGKKILITAGPTHEHLDPVRFIGNNSSGKMGVEIAKECVGRGAEVTVILGPVNLEIPNRFTTIKVISAEQMAKSVLDNVKNQDIVIFSAAVADYTPISYSDSKIKKSEDKFSLELIKTIDIAAQVGKIKKPGQILVGFALETNDEIENAQKKLKSKNLDLIILNSLKDEGAGFGFDTNKISIISSKDNNTRHFELKKKADVAADIVNEIVTLL